MQRTHATSSVTMKALTSHLSGWHKQRAEEPLCSQNIYQSPQFCIVRPLLNRSRKSQYSCSRSRLYRVATSWKSASYGNGSQRPYIGSQSSNLKCPTKDWQIQLVADIGLNIFLDCIYVPCFQPFGQIAYLELICVGICAQHTSER